MLFMACIVLWLTTWLLVFLKVIKKELELVGVGYRASNNGNIIDFALGYTHNIFYAVAS